MSLSEPHSISVRRSFLVVIAVLTLLPASLRADTGEPRFIRHGGAVPSEYVVVLPDGTPSKDVDAIAGALARDYRLKVIRTYHAALPGFHCRASARAAQKLVKDARVAFVEENFTGRVSSVASATENASCDAVKGWTRHRITHRDNLPTPDPNLPPESNYPYPHASDGEGVVAFVLDTGVWAKHAQFDGRVKYGHNAIKDSRGDVYALDPCTDVTSGDSVQASRSHGTSVASLLGGNTMGIAPKVTIASVRVLPCGGSDWQLADVLDGIDWAVGPAVPHPKGAVLNMSFEGPLGNFSTLQLGSLKAALASAAKNGIMAFAVAGNAPFDAQGQAGSGNSCDSVIASFGYGSGQPSPHVIVTSGTNTDDTREINCTPGDKVRCGGGREFGYGQCVDLFAPATCVRAAVIGANDNDTSAERQSDFNGTSWASPMTAGAAARLLDEYPSLSSVPSETSYKVWRMLRDTATHGVVVAKDPDTQDRNKSPDRLLYIGAVKIQTQPQSVFVAPDSGTTPLTVVVDPSESGVSYQWYRGAYKSSSKIDGETSDRYNAPTNATESYWVRVTKGGLTTDSMLATVTVCAARPRATITANAPSWSFGACISPFQWGLSVDDATGSGYDWYIGAPGDTSRLLKQTGVAASCLFIDPATTTEYWVRVKHSDSCDVDSANAAKIDVCPPPQITSAPPYLVVVPYDPLLVGGPAAATTLTVTATGSDLTYQWYRVDPATKASSAVGGNRPNLDVAMNGIPEQEYYVVVTGCGGATAASIHIKVAFVLSVFGIKVRQPNEPVAPPPLNATTPFDADHHVVDLALPPQTSPPTIYVPSGRSIALTAQPYYFDGHNYIPTKAITTWTTADLRLLLNASPHYFENVSGTVTATAVQANAPSPRNATIQTCGQHALVATPPVGNDAGVVSLTLTSYASNVTVEWYQGEHDDHLGPFAQQINLQSGATVGPGRTLDKGRYWARVIGHLDDCSATNVTEDTPLFTVGSSCTGRCPGQRLRTGIVRVNNVAMSYYALGGQPATLTPPKDNEGGDTYEWRHNSTWDLTETPFSTAAQINNAPAATYWVSTTHTDGSIEDSWVTTIAPQPPAGLISVDLYPDTRFVGGQATIVMVPHPPAPPANACDVKYNWYEGNTYDHPPSFPPYDSDTDPLQLTLFDIPDTATFFFEMTWKSLDGAGQCTGSTTTLHSDFITMTVICDPPAGVTAEANPQFAAQNELVTFTATGRGKLLEYSWYEGHLDDKTHFLNIGRNAYQRLSADKSLWVEAVDACGNVSKAEVTVLVCKPTITTQPAATTIIRSDQTKQLTIAASPAQPGQTLSYQWWHTVNRGAWELMAGATGPTLNVTAPSASYKCYASGSCTGGAGPGVVESEVAQVNVCAPPTVNPLPPTDFVRTDRYETLSVQATGTDLTYQWFRGQSGDINNRIDGATDASYSFLPTLNPSTLKFWVRVYSQGECFADSNTVTVIVCSAPQINSGPTATPVSVFSGGSATLTVSATKTSDADLHYAWYEATNGLGNVLVCDDQPTCTTGPLTAAKIYFVRITSGTLVSIDSPQVTVSICTFPQSIPGAPDMAISTGDYTLTLPLDPADGNTITWYRGASGDTSTQLQTGASNALLIHATASDQYWAKVERGVCTSFSTTTHVNVCVPRAVTQPASGSIVAGDSYTMTFSADGTDAPLAYQWYRGNRGDTRDPVPGATSSSVTVSPTATTTYFCRATSNCGRTSDSNDATVAVCTRPVITGAYGSSIAPGGVGVVRVDATGDTLTYQWYRGASGNTAQLISGAVNPLFNESPASTSSYWCRVTANGGCWADGATVTINVCVPASITAQPADVKIAAGQTAQLSVTATGAGGYQWLLSDGTPIGGATTATYTTPVLNADATYRVRVFNGLCITDSRDATVTVCSLSASASPAAQPLLDGPAVLTAAAGNARGDQIQYTWYVGASGDTSHVWMSGPPSIAVVPQSTTQYWVRVSDGTCTADSNTATVQVCRAVITAQPANAVRASNQASVAVSVTATGATAYQWYAGEKGDITSPVPSGTTATINVSPTADTRYWVRVAGTCGLDSRGEPIGPVDSESALVTYCNVPAITQTTPSQWISRGSSITIGVAATGSNLTYQWYVGATGNTSSPIATGANVTVAPTNTTSYWVRVSGCNPPADSNTITISVCLTPSITAQPQSVSIFSGGTATLSVTATEGTPAPMSYQWYRGASGDESNLIAGATSSSYTTPALTANTSYWIKIFCGTCAPALSQTATVSMCANPAIVGSSGDVQTTIGQTSTLSVSATGSSYAWYTGPAGDTSHPYVSGNYPSISVSPSTTTQYWAQVTNGTCVSRTNTITVNVCVPTITSQPAGGMYTPGGAAFTLTVAANTPGLTYQWYAGASGTTTSPVPGGTGASVGVSPSADTSYWVRVTGSCGRTADSAAALVTVCQKPTITATSPSQSIVRGSSVTLVVQATGTNLTYQWYTGAKGDTSAPISGGTGTTVNLSPLNTTNYWVRVSGACTPPADSNTITISVCATPTVTAQPQSVSIFSGSTTTLSVTATEATTTPVSYAWYRGTSPDTTNPVGAAATYTTPALTANTSYWVRISCGTCTPADSQTATVSMCALPAVVGSSGDVQISPGQTTQLSVSATGSSYAWYIGAAGDTSHLYVSGNYQWINVSPATTTQYWAQVTNGSCVSRTNTITVTPCVPQITTQPQGSTILAGNSATMTVAASTTGVAYQWYVGTSGTTSTPVGGAVGTSFTVTPAATTNYWVRATSTCGRTADSNTATITVCTPATITRQPSNATWTNPGYTSTVSVDATGPSLTYQWYAGESGDTHAPIDARTSNSTSTTSTLSFPLFQTMRVWVRVSGMCGPPADSVAVWMTIIPTVYGPADQTVSYGSAASLRVSASGTGGYVSYQWNGPSGTINGATSSTLIVPNVTSAGGYSCTVTSGTATIYSRSAWVDVCYGPSVSITVTNNGPSCRFINANISGVYSGIEWYQGLTGDTAAYVTSGQASIMVCPSTATKYWCRVYGTDSGTGAACNADSIAVTVP